MSKFLKATLAIILAGALFTGGYFFGGSNEIVLVSGRPKLLPRASSELNLDLLYEVYDIIRSHFLKPIDRNALEESAAAGFVAGLNDPYSEYLSVKDSKALRDELAGEVSGIGAEIGKRDGHVVIIAPLENSPAKEAGLQAGDIILFINDESASRFTAYEAALKIRGAAGTKVKLKIQRGDKIFDVELTRRVVKVPSTSYKMLEPKIGYLKISIFASDVKGQVSQAAELFNGNDTKVIILDLRNDPGGLVDQATGFLDEVYESGTLVTQETRDGNKKETSATKGGSLINKKFVILMNEGSASASEIVAGALMDLSDTPSVGVKTYGKGSVQQPFSLSNGAELKLTVAHWLTPKGTLIDGNGLTPKIIIENPDDQLKKAIEVARSLK